MHKLTFLTLALFIFSKVTWVNDAKFHFPATPVHVMALRLVLPKSWYFILGISNYYMISFLVYLHFDGVVWTVENYSWPCLLSY